MMNFLLAESIVTPILTSVVIASAVTATAQFLIFKLGHSGKIQTTEAQVLWDTIKEQNTAQSNRITNLEEKNDSCQKELEEVRRQWSREVENLYLELRKLRKSSGSY